MRQASKQKTGKTCRIMMVLIQKNRKRAEGTPQVQMTEETEKSVILPNTKLGQEDKRKRRKTQGGREETGEKRRE